ncbi:MAG: diguanylate cyclase [Legionella sp.]
MDGQAKSPQNIDDEIFAEQNKANDISKQIDLKKISILHTNLSLSMTANILCATLVFLSSYTSPTINTVWGWYMATILVSLLRFFLPRFYLSQAKSITAQFNLFTIGVVISAILWGLIDSVFLPANNLLHHMIIIIIVAGITAGGVQTLQASLTACLLSTTIILLPLCLWFFLQDSMAYLILGISMTVYMFSMLIIAYRGNRMLTQILSLHYENALLVENLSLANNKLHEYALSTEASEQLFRNILENAPIGMLIISPEGACQQANLSLTEMIGYTQDELKKLTTKDIVYPDDLTKELEAEQRLIQGILTFAQLEKRYIHKSGQLIWAIANISLINDSSGKPLYFIVQILDISERKRNEMKMLELNERTASTLSELRQRDIEMSYIKKMTDMLQICQDSNEAYAVIAIAAQDLFPTLSGAFVINDASTLKMKTVQQWGSQQIVKPEFGIDECWALRSGSTYIINDVKKDLICHHFTSSPCGGCLCLPLIGPVGVIGMLILNAAENAVLTENHKQLAVTLSEIIKLFLANIQLRESLQDLSVRDPLTGLFNRRYLDETLAREILQVTRNNSTLCVGMLDVDNFKNFNDTYGHEAGDTILKFIGNTLKENFRGSDLACRFGGEEFILILIDANLTTAAKRLNQISNKIKTTRVPFKNTMLPQITVSIGLSEAPTQGSSTEEVIRHADEALYKAKNNGRDRVEVYENRSVGKMTG